VFGNPSSLHSAGQQAAALIEEARARVAAGIGAAPDEICFASGATEADNHALFGVMRARQQPGGHLITCAVEHHAVLHAAQALEREGVDVTYLPVDGVGLVNPDAVRKAIRPDTALISIMMVNNEVGAVQPIREIGRIAREHGILFHTDAVQAVGLFDVDVDELGVDLLSLSAHKIYGPKGIGALYIRRGVNVSPILYGGPQEATRRPGTENVPGIAGLGAAVQLTLEHKAEEYPRLQALRARLIEGLREAIPGTTVNGPLDMAAPHVASLSFPGVDGEMLLFRLNAEGIAASMGSACTAEDIQPSHVLVAMGLPREQIEGTLRLSLGFPTTVDDIDYVCEVLPVVAARCR
jgi:cysteine desulfurase